MARLRSVVFDFDGVLVDSNAVKRNAYFQIFAGTGASDELIGQTLLSQGDGDRYQIIAAILAGMVAAGLLAAERAGTGAVSELAAAYNGICEEYAASCAAIGGAEEALRALDERYGLYVNSATPEEPLRRIVARRGWAPHFRAVLGRPRSKAENLGLAMAREGCGPDATLLVGDGRHDLAAARLVGCHFIGVRNIFNDFEADGLTMIDDLHELPARITALEAKG
jgi:phosphoglycolate phosphatase-like HAD superfamily hydrolase